MKEELPYILVHGREKYCPRADVAIEIGKGLAARIKRDPLCMVCGQPALKAVKKARK